MIATILALAWPTMLEQLMQTAVQYIDTAMVGSLGTQATAAVGATTTINWLLNSTLSALGVGFLAFVSQACGSGDREKPIPTTEGKYSKDNITLEEEKLLQKINRTLFLLNNEH